MFYKVSEMPYMCSIPCCRNTSTAFSYHKFPENSKLRKLWMDLTGIRMVTESTRLCSDHFNDNDFFPRRLSAKRKRLFPSALPSKYLTEFTLRLPFVKEWKKENQKKARELRMEKRMAKETDNDDSTVSLHLDDTNSSLVDAPLRGVQSVDEGNSEAMLHDEKSVPDFRIVDINCILIKKLEKSTYQNQNYT